MTLTFADFDALTEALVEAALPRVAAITDANVKRGFSNQSCSAYLLIDFVNEEGDYLVDEDGDGASFKLRFSNHGDRHGSDRTFRIDDLVEVVEMDGCYDHVEVAPHRFDELVDEAVAAAVAFREKLA